MHFIQEAMTKGTILAALDYNNINRLQINQYEKGHTGSHAIA